MIRCLGLDLRPVWIAAEQPQSKEPLRLATKSSLVSQERMVPSQAGKHGSEAGRGCRRRFLSKLYAKSLKPPTATVANLAFARPSGNQRFKFASETIMFGKVQGQMHHRTSFATY